jgi:hypothetical protein
MSSPGNAVDLQRLTSAVSRFSGKKCNAPRRTYFEDQDSPNLASSADKYSFLAAIASERTERPRVPELVFVETSGKPIALHFVPRIFVSPCTAHHDDPSAWNQVSNPRVPKGQMAYEIVALQCV